MGNMLAEAMVLIGIETGAFTAGIAGMKGAVAGLGSALAAATGGLSIVIGAIAAGAVALGGSLGICAAAAMEAETSNLGLASALKAAGQDVEGTMGSWDAYTKQMMKATTVGDEVASDAAKLAINMGLPAEKLQTATTAAIGLSRAYGMDLNSAMTMVAKESLGVTSKLDKQIPALKGVTDQTQRLAIISEAAGRGLAQEEDVAQTASGSLQKMWTAIGELGETIGSLFIPAITWAAQLIEQVTWFLNDMVAGAMENSSVLKFLGDVMKTLAGYIEFAVMALLNFPITFELVRANINLFVNQAIDRFNWLWTNIKIGAEWVASIFPEAWALATSAIGASVGGLSTTVKIVISSLMATFNAALSGIRIVAAAIGAALGQVRQAAKTGSAVAMDGAMNSILTKEGKKNFLDGPQFKMFGPEFESEATKEGKKSVESAQAAMAGAWKKWQDDKIANKHLEEPQLEKADSTLGDVKKKEKKAKKDSEAGSFQGLGEAFKKANNAANKEKEAKDKEQLKLAKEANKVRADMAKDIRTIATRPVGLA